MTYVYVKNIDDFNDVIINLDNINPTRKAYLEKLNPNSQKISYYAWILLKEKVFEVYNLDIDKLKLKYNDNGKPLFDEFFFNISHSRELIAVAISNEEVGIDVQAIEGKDVSKLSKRLQVSSDDLPAFYKVFSSLGAKGKKEGNGILPSSLLNKNKEISKQLMLTDNDYNYVLSIDCEDDKNINISY